MEERRRSTMMIVVVLITFLIAIALIAIALSKHVAEIVFIAAIMAVAIIIVGYFRYAEDTDHLRARQSDRILKLASDTLPYMRKGLNQESAQGACKFLLPIMAADAVAITDTEKILAYEGFESEYHHAGQAIRTRTTEIVLSQGRLHIDEDYEGLSDEYHQCGIRSAIVAPLMVQNQAIGTIKFYYRNPQRISELRVTMTEGLAELLSTQLSLAELDAQTELATKLELKALQAQINPHFLFNTINTITALVRTDPVKARDLLREFAAFYRGTLQNSSDFISLEQEIQQTSRYMNLLIARFGENRIEVDYQISPEINTISLPSFIIQPIVENSIVHGFKPEEKLYITIKAYRDGNDAIIAVEDNGMGISEDKIPHLLESRGDGTGIALGNVDNRLKAVFGSDSGLEVTSTELVGTNVHLVMKNAFSIRGKSNA